MAQPTRGPEGLKNCGRGTYVYFGKYIIRRYGKDAAWTVRDYAGNLLTTGKTLKETCRNIDEMIASRAGGAN